VSEPFPEIVRSRAVVLRGDNIDTDVITPIARVVEGGDAVVKFAFEPLRFGRDGSPLATDPFADPDRQGAQVLVAGENFGCGSSRETAATAVRGMGFRVVLAPSYGDIFYSNCLKNGVLPIRLPPTAFEVVRAFAEGLGELSVELDRQELWVGDQAIAFEVGPLQKEMLARGLDDLGLMRARADLQAAFEARDAALRPWVRRRRAHA
jgi:3-isopropylmalate/(R)-2-methylmalate dehydratase small subunit